MRRLTFNGFLERYVRALSMNATNSLYKLVREVPTNHRLREPLLLYALSSGKTNVLLRASAGTELHAQYSKIVANYSWNDMINALEAKDESLDRNYHKAYRSYISRRDALETDNDTKTLMHSKIKRLQNSKRVSNYRIYKDLGLNHGNANAFLKCGDVSKVSLDTARSMVTYLESR
jgi:hypothetical protein